MTIYLIRHAETIANASLLIQGTADSELSAVGQQQAQQLTKLFAQQSITAIYTSNSQRAMQTIQPVADQHHLPITTLSLLQEKSYGIYDGQPIAQAHQSVLDIQTRANQLPDLQRLEQLIYEQGESDGQAARRLLTAFKQIFTNYPNGQVIVVSHGAAIRALLILIQYTTYQQSPRGFLKNSSVVTMKFDGQTCTVINIQHPTI